MQLRAQPESVCTAMTKTNATFDEAFTSARQYVAGLESYCEGKTDLSGLETTLAYVYATMLRVPDQSGLLEEESRVEISHEQWKHMFDQVQARLTSSSYHSIFDGNFDLTKQPEVDIGEIADDLADIWRDLSRGLTMLREGAGPEEVLWDLWFNFRHHWARHAVDAMQAIHRLHQL
jgi:hypothetical protein